jgi:hypothetical protein
MENQKSILESAKEYSPKQTFNVAELPSVDVNLKLENRDGTDDEGKPFSYKVVIVDNKEYRVPSSVLEKLREALKIRADIKKFKVNRSGSGLNTRYSIEVLE